MRRSDPHPYQGRLLDIGRGKVDEGMLERTGFMPIAYLKKTSYTGSYQGMRFKMERARVGEGEEEKDVLRVTHWPEPFGYDATKEELKTRMDTSFDEEGICKGIEWLNREHGERYQER